MKPVFGFDLDGVLYPWTKAAYEYVKYTQESRELYVEPYEEFWKQAVTNTDPYPKLFWDNLVLDKTLYSMYSAKQEDVETVKKLSKRFDIVYITHRNKTLKHTTLKWLKDYRFPNFENVIFSDKPKDILVRLHNCKYYIEDKPDILDSNLKNVTNLFAFSWPWNEYLRGTEGITFVDSIKEILDYV